MNKIKNFIAASFLAMAFALNACSCISPTSKTKGRDIASICKEKSTYEKEKVINTPEEAAKVILQYKNAYCENAAKVIYFWLHNKGYKPIVARGKSQGLGFHHYVFAFKENGLYGSVDNIWGYTQPRYQTLDNLFESLAKKVGIQCVKCDKILTEISDEEIRQSIKNLDTAN